MILRPVLRSREILFSRQDSIDHGSGYEIGAAGPPRLIHLSIELMTPSTTQQPSKLRIAACCSLVFAIILIVPFIVYSGMAVVTGTQPPEDSSAGVFMISVLIEKIGHSIAFVLVFYLGRRSLTGHWLLYAIAWWVMFALGELALAVRQPTYTAEMAVGGVIAEAIYLPLAAFAVQRLIGVRSNTT